MTKTKSKRLAVALVAVSLLAACSGSAVDAGPTEEPTRAAPRAAEGPTPLPAPSALPLPVAVAAQPVAEAPASPVAAPAPVAPVPVSVEPEAAPEPEPAATPEPVPPVEEPEPEPVVVPEPIGLYDACTLEAECPDALTCAQSSDPAFSGNVCRPTATVQYGDVCTYDDECRSQFCGPSGIPHQRSCSRVSLPLGTGDLCDTDDQCESNRCDFEFGYFSCCTYPRRSWGRQDCIQ